MPSFLIVTTRDLREAYVLARFRQDRRQRFGILNITGRPLRDAVRVLRRLRRKPVGGESRNEGGVAEAIPSGENIDLSAPVRRATWFTCRTEG